jgi:hypothetical protein
MPNVITVNRCVGIAWDNKRVSPEEVITKGTNHSNGHRYIRRILHSKVSLGVTVIEERNLALTSEEESPGMNVAEESRDPAS